MDWRVSRHSQVDEEEVAASMAAGAGAARILEIIGRLSAVRGPCRLSSSASFCVFGTFVRTSSEGSENGPSLYVHM